MTAWALVEACYNSIMGISKWVMRQGQGVSSEVVRDNTRLKAGATSQSESGESGSGQSVGPEPKA